MAISCVFTQRLYLEETLTIEKGGNWDHIADIRVSLTLPFVLSCKGTQMPGVTAQ